MDIKISNLKKYYGKDLVLDIDSLNIKKETLTCISGANGSGKSTLLHIINGLDKDFSGQVLYNSNLLNTHIQKSMTLVTQKPYLFRRTVYDNIAYPLKIRNYSKSDVHKKVDLMLKYLKIEDLKDKKAHKLSGGETQKVSLARALVFNPRLLLLDEPTSNIDLETTKIIEEAIVEYVNNKGTVIMVTHDREQSERLAKEFIYLESGKLIERW